MSGEEARERYSSSSQQRNYDDGYEADIYDDGRISDAEDEACGDIVRAVWEDEHPNPESTCPVSRFESGGIPVEALLHYDYAESPSFGSIPWDNDCPESQDSGSIIEDSDRGEDFSNFIEMNESDITDPGTPEWDVMIVRVEKPKKKKKVETPAEPQSPDVVFVCEEKEEDPSPKRPKMTYCSVLGCCGAYS